MYKFMNSKQTTRIPKNDTADRFRKHLILSKYFKLCLVKNCIQYCHLGKKSQYYKSGPPDKYDNN